MALVPLDQESPISRSAGPSDRPTPLLLWARAAVLGAAVLAAGAVSHASAGGRLPGVAGTVALLGACVVAGAGFLRRPASPRRLVVLVVSGQVLVHLALSAAAGHRGDPVAAQSSGRATASPVVSPIDGSGRRVGSLFDQWEAAHSVPVGRGSGADPLRHLVDHVTGQPPAMLLAHLAGAVALALWLAIGEQALWRLVWLAAARLQVRGALSRVLARPARIAPPRLTYPSLAARRSTARPLQRLACRQVVRRGPPSLLAI